MREFKAAIFDLDGTLTNSDKEVTKRNREAIYELHKMGVTVVLASGRPTYGIAPIAEMLELEKYGGYILAYNGGVITECETGRVIYSQTLPQHLLKPLYDRSREAGFVMLSYDGDAVVSEDIECQYVKYEAMLNRMSLREVPSLLKHFPDPIPKALAVGEPSQSEALVQQLRDLYGEQMSIYLSEPFFVELVPLGIDKARSLSRLMEHLSIDSSDVVAFGDAFNDMSMLKWAGCGVAMANGQSAVREIADFVTASNDEDGVAQFIECEMLG